MSSRNSNIYREQAWSWLTRFLVAGIVLVCLAHSAYALDPNRSLSQYIRDRWGSEKGFPGGPIHAITQTGDGYLWIATEKGLARFDGLTFRLFQHANTPELPAGPVLGLATDAEGKLWIRSRGASLLRYSAGRFEQVSSEPLASEPGVTAMGRATNGEILVAGLVSGILRYSAGKFSTVAAAMPLPNFLVISLAEGLDGTIWMGTRDLGLYSLRQGTISAITKGLPDRKINSLLAIGTDEVWIGTDNGLARWNGREVSAAGLDPSLSHVQVLTLIRDRDANIWAGTTSGLFRIKAQGTVAVSPASGRGATAVSALFEDREGNIWAGDNETVERIRDSAFVTYSSVAGMPAGNAGPIYVDTQNRAWFAPGSGGLYWIKGGQVERVTAAGLNNDVVYSITGSGDELWLGRQRGGLTHLRFKDGAYFAETYTQAHGLAQNNVFAVYRTRDGTVWAGTLSGGASRFTGGKFTTYANSDGLASNTVNALLETSNGTMWFATPNGLSALSKDNWQTFRSGDGLPSDRVNCLTEDSTGVLWAGTDIGLAFYRNGRFQTPPKAPALLQEQILGLVEDKIGSLWLTTANHVLRVTRDSLLRGELSEADIHQYGLADGLPSSEGVRRYQSVTRDPQGMVWFSLSSGLALADPARLARPSVPAIVHINTVSADGASWDLGSPIRIPSARQRISFSFVGLSLATPERVKFRYVLDGLDHAWSEPIAAGEAIYTNLSPGPYRFRVIASNGDGVWNSGEDVIAFEITPAFWQTWWFKIAALLLLGLTGLALYRLRLHQLTRRLNVRFEERLAERTLIAQELHDTLLQGFLSASMQLDIAVDGLPPDLPAKPRLAGVLDLMRQVNEEGRNALRGLRSANVNGSANLEQAFSHIHQEIGLGESVGFRVIAEGTSRPLHSLVRDEVYRIGREAVVNAFRHAQANEIEVEVGYLGNHLRVVVRDDGRGIDPEILQSGRDGHWGLSGMRERAERIGARLKVRSREGSGTEVELTVPRDVAFPAQPSDQAPRWYARILHPRAGRNGVKK